MKIRKQLIIQFFSNSSKAFHNQEINIGKQKSLSELIDNISSKIQSISDQKVSIKSFNDIIQRCYNNRNNQFQLCQALNIPFVAGPIALNALPDSFFQQEYLSSEDIETNVLSQINYLFEFLKKTKEYYYCWIIYYNDQLKILTVKMMKKYQLKQNIELLNPLHCMIGIFVNRQISLPEKNGQKININHNKIENNQKITAYSCYNPTSKFELKSKKLLKHPKKAPAQKVKNSQSVYSLKSIKSSKTNSSSFKNLSSTKDLSEKQTLKEASFQCIQKDQFDKKTSKLIKNFKKKKNISPTTIQTKNKIVKSISNKFVVQKNKIFEVKSLQKIINFQASQIKSPKQYKSQLFRSISNNQKYKKSLKQKLTSKKIMFGKQDQNTEVLNRINYNSPQKVDILSKNLIRSRKLSKTKIYSSCISLNATTIETKNLCQQKELNNKIIPLFMKRKLSSSKQDFKKKKMDSTKFSSSKNSFDLS